ncbi:recombinase family protein [Amphibacillus sp. Q70]|uniref:recombinase family protein n=1 Tax=Amphibacillus sp. Q70 TaxID=3453416 RepID=UPI003F84D95E
MPKAIGYVRVSTNKQLENTSIEKQKEEIQKYCENNNITLVTIYDEGAKSAESVKNRLQFKQMYNHLFGQSEQIDYLIVHKADRLSRDSIESQYMFSRIENSGKQLICIADNIDSSDKNAKLMYQILSLVSEFERDLISFRSSFGMQKNAEKGNYNGGQIYGYVSKDKKLKPVSSEAKVVKYIFQRYTYDNWGYGKIAANLNNQNITTKKKNDWSISGVRDILHNVIYNGKTKWKGVIREGNHVKIIDDELWQETQKALAIRNKTNKRETVPGKFILSGLLKCPKCGSTMVQAKGQKIYQYYRCGKNKSSGNSVCSSNLINKSNAEQAVLQDFFMKVKSLNITPLLTTVTQNTLQYEIEPLEENIKKTHKELEELSSKKKELLNLYLSKTINETTFKSEIQDAEVTEIQLHELLENLKKKKKQRHKNDLSNSMDKVIDNFEKFFHLLTVEEQKKLLHSFIDEIHISETGKPAKRKIEKVIYAIDNAHFANAS